MPDDKKRYPYHAYLLRCWREGKATPGESPRWRFSLEGVLHKRPRQGFDSLEKLIACVQAELDDERSTIKNTDEKLNRAYYHLVKSFSFELQVSARA